MDPRAPELSVVVPAHDRPLRLRFLLNALAEQTVPAGRFEVVVVHDSRGEETTELLETHELGHAGALRHERMPARALAAIQRNRGWRMARAPLVVFTDDDCRPPADWVANVLAATARHPGAVVQGATRPDPDESWMLLISQHARSQDIDPPTPWAETCNIAYPRALLEALGGFSEAPPLTMGEDTDLAARARKMDAPHVGAPEMLTYHAVDVPLIRARLRSLPRWRDVPLVLRWHPELRRAMYLRVFWKRNHFQRALALAGAALARRLPVALVLAAPYVVGHLRHYGHSPRGIARAATELPGRLVYDLAETAVIVSGSTRHRSLLI
ncbi:MAG: glycosyltransferase [Solirubrobacteraceae bacterium]